MRIKILGLTDPLVLKELKVINDGFFDDWELVDQDADLVFAPPSHNVDKYTCLRAYLTFLETHFGRQQPWGLLNGMRPNKLIHSMKKRGMSEADISQVLQDTYLVQVEKLDLLLKIANHQLAVIPDLHQLEKEISLYIGIPFCPTRCTYCTFAAYAYAPNKKWVMPFLEALLAEINLVGDHLKKNHIKVTSIYVGGGTPTMLDVTELETLLTGLRHAIPNYSDVREITVEAGRPDTITKEKLQLLKDFNVHRISINPQSFNQNTLDLIGRHHSVEEVIQSFHSAKETGIENVNMDLIVGLPNEKKSSLMVSLEEVAKLQPESLTVHMLAFKRKSELTSERGLYAVTEKEVLKEMAQMTYDFAKRNSYIPYYLYRQKNISGNLENIGYAKKGYECLYNILMMEEAQNVLGLGVGASSKFLIGESVHNPKDLRTYIENVDEYAHRKLEILTISLKNHIKSFTYN